MQVCRILCDTPTIRTGAGTCLLLLVRPRTSISVHADHRRTLAGTASKTLHELPDLSASRKRISILLRKATSLLPQTLSIADNAVGPDSTLFWSSILERSIDELNSSSDQVPLKATIAVCGFNKWASSHDLVSALLEDPFASDSTYSDILRNRWENDPGRINIEYGKPTAFSGELFSPSDWLRRFPYAIRLTEFPDLSSQPSISDETDGLLLNSDVLLLLCDPVVTPLPDLAIRAKHLLNKPNTILILTWSSISDSHRQFVSQTLSGMGCRPGHVLFVDPRRALGAVTALQANPTSPSTIDRYQRDTLESRISAISVAINEVLGPKNQSKTPLLGLRQKIALLQVRGSLSASLRSIEATTKDIDSVASKIDNLLSGVQRVRENTRHDIFGKPGEGNNIEKAVCTSAKEMSAVLGSLSFWKMVWQVDEIGSLVSTAVQRQWCKGLENQLILQTGRLQFTQRELTASAFSLLSVSPLRSPVLENQLQQLKCSPAHALALDSLIQPIHDRRGQLIQYTTTKLHHEAQSAVIGAFGGILSGAGLGWWLALGEHILSVGAGTEMGTAIGSGALLAVSSIRWAVGKWERAKQRWLQDSARVGEGLARDLQGTMQRTLDDNVTIVASTACKGMQALVDRRRNEIDRLYGELHDLESELHACAQFPPLWTGRNPSSIEELDTE